MAATIPLPADRVALAEKWVHLAKYVRRRMQYIPAVRRFPDDCEQAGQIGLVKAARLWREDNGTPFPSFAYVVIKNLILQEVERLDRLYRHEVTNDPVPDRETPANLSHGDRLDIPPLLAAVAQLPPRQRQLVEVVYGLDGKGGMPITAAGPVLGVSKQRSHQLHVKAIGQLTATLRHNEASRGM